LAQAVLIPPTHEQERIVAKLERAVSAIQRAEMAAIRALERLQRYRVAVLASALRGELTGDWRSTRKNEGDSASNGNLALQKVLALRRNHWERAELEHFKLKGTLPKNDQWKSQYPEPATPDATGMPRIPPTWAWASLEMIAEIASGISVSRN